ncbi:MAG TPA: hypothetical protein VFM87_08885 [Agrococcus sp.]|nr:hypothetical protein [Agrococcus sp.]
MKTKWIAVTAASALGIGTIAAGAMSVASAVEIRDAQGHTIEAAQIRGDIVDSGPVAIKTTGDHASVVSATHAPTPTTPPTAPSATEAPAANPAPQQAPAPVAVPSADSVHSAASNG